MIIQEVAVPKIGSATGAPATSVEVLVSMGSRGARIQITICYWFRRGPRATRNQDTKTSTGFGGPNLFGRVQERPVAGDLDRVRGTETIELVFDKRAAGAGPEYGERKQT